MKSIFSLITLSLTLFSSVSMAAGDGLTEKMNALFPPKKPVMEKREVPATPELTAPAFFAKVKGTSVTLNWSKVEGASEYHVQVSTEPTFTNNLYMVKNEYHVTDTNFEVTSLEAGKQYYWRVAAVKDNNWTTLRKGFFASSMFETPAK